MAKARPEALSRYLVEDPAALVAALEANLELRHGKTTRQRRTFLDTFDGSLYRKGALLAASRRGKGWELTWSERGRGPRASASCERLPTFADTLPAGPIAAGLATVVGIRSLLPIAEIQGRVRHLEVLDKRRKIVARLSLAEYDPKDAATSLLRLEPVKGYGAAAATLRALLAGLEGVSETHDGELERACAAAGRPVGVDPSEFRPRFGASDDTGEAIRQALGRLLEIVRIHRDGTVRDLDSEFLHDLRVAVRRARSILSLLRDYLPKRPRQRLAAELKWLGGVTGPTRDLDVYLLKLDDYRAPLSAPVQGQLDPLLELLAKRRRQEQKRLARALRSQRFEALLERWQDFCEEPRKEPETASLEVRETAGRLLRKARKRLLRKGRAISDESPDEALHRLRIDGKKLRYLLELFRSLFPASDMKRVLRALKGLQDVLGDFNDLCVHQQAIAELAAELDDANALMATGRLIEHLAARAEGERQRFAERFADLDSPRLDEIFRRFEGRGAK
ncbi:MAG: CHAD domain-containing protein [Acidobacteriota bacterium]